MIDGWDTLEAMEKVPSDDKTFRPKQDFALKSITIHANPLAERD